jgi:hypothetical protein
MNLRVIQGSKRFRMMSQSFHDLFGSYSLELGYSVGWRGGSYKEEIYAAYLEGVVDKLRKAFKQL